MQDETTRSTRRFRLGTQLLIWLLLISLLPVVAVSVYSFNNFRQALADSELRKVAAIAERTAHELEVYLQDEREITTLLTRVPAVTDTLNFLIDLDAERAANLTEDPTYQQLQRLYADSLPTLSEKFHYNEIFLVTPKGLVASAAGDVAPLPGKTSVEEYGGKNLARLYERVAESRKTYISRFDNSRLTGKATLYIGAPVERGRSFLGVLIVGLNSNQVYQLLANTTGLGNSGENILATQRDGKLVFLNNTRNAPADEPTAFSFTVPAQLADGETHPILQAIENKEGSGIYTDYRGEETFAAWRIIPSMGWAIVTKIDADEALKPALDLRNRILLFLCAVILVVLATAVLLSRSITRPVEALTSAARRLADGDLTVDPTVRSKNEIGTLARAFSAMSQSLKKLIHSAKQSASLAHTTASELTDSSQQQMSTAQQTRASAVEITETARDIARTADKLTHTMQEVSKVANNTALNAESGIDGLGQMTGLMDELADANREMSAHFQTIQDKATAIDAIILTMTKVADQTNLLSLNAAIEARRAGEAGKGFAVVAREIRRLADQTATSTLDIEKMIGEMHTAVKAGVSGIDSFSERVHNGTRTIKDVSTRITAAIQEVQGLPPRFEQVLEGMTTQNKSASQITEAMDELSTSARHTADGLQQTQSKLESLRESVEKLQQEIDRFRSS